MKTYKCKELNHALLPRRGSKLIMKLRELDYVEGEERYNNAEQLETNGFIGPLVGPGDKVILLLEFVGKEPHYFEIEYRKDV